MYRKDRSNALMRVYQPWSSFADKEEYPSRHLVGVPYMHGGTGCLWWPLQDVVYGAANLKAMSFIGGGALDFRGFFEFLGTVKDARVPPAGSPFQMTFPGQAATPAGMAPANESVTACWAPDLKCSCGDCPDGPQCAPVRAPPHLPRAPHPAAATSAACDSMLGWAPTKEWFFMGFACQQVSSPRRNNYLNWKTPMLPYLQCFLLPLRQQSLSCW